MNNRESEVHDAMALITRAWRENRPTDMYPCIHADVTTVFPGFSGAIRGRDNLLAGFVEFCQNARVLEYNESDEQIHIIHDVGVVSYRFDMLYERASYRERSTGRDIWVFERVDGKWTAVWRTMVDLQEQRQTGK